MSLRLTFLGAAGTVTGSKYLLELGSRRVLTSDAARESARSYASG